MYQVEKGVEDQVWGQVMDQVWGQVMGQVWGKAMPIICYQIWWQYLAWFSSFELIRHMDLYDKS